MLSKKHLLVATLFLTTPLLSFAENLVTTNNTSRPSTVKINEICVGLLPVPFKVVTPPHGQSSVPRVHVDTICGGRDKQKCFAAIHMTPDCSDTSVATAQFNLVDFTIDSIKTVEGAPYNIHWSDTYVVIDPA